MGAKLGRYEILAKLAAGGMAIVYVARVLGVAGFERLVAIKVLHSNLAHEEEFIKMFLDEARLAASIRHPNVVPTIDISDSEKSGYFLVMEYIEGDHLGQLLSSANKAGEKLPIPATLRVIGDALGGLGAAHDLTDEQGKTQNLVHRDVSPHNIMVGRDGVARLTDFGVAKAEDRLTHTRDGQVKGKLAYMAPEQAASGTTDTRSDLFSMGVILWECVTGQRLMRAESTAATLHKLLHGEIPRPSSVDPHLAPLDPVLEKALARDASLRFQTAEEFARALEDVAGAYGGPASLREVGKIVKHYAAIKLKRDKKLIDDALKMLRPAGTATEAEANSLLEETSSPSSPSNSEISIMAGASPSLISKVGAVTKTANETMPGTRRAGRRTGEVPIPDRKPAPPPPLGAAGLVPSVAPALPPSAADVPLDIDIISAPATVPDLSPIVIGGSPSLPPARRVPWAVVLVGAAALVLVGVWASSSPQETVRVEEMTSPQSQPIPEHPEAATPAPAAPLDGRPVTNLTAAVPAAAVPSEPVLPQPDPAEEPTPTAPAADSEPSSAKPAQTIVPVVPNAVVVPRIRETPNKTPRISVRRHREPVAAGNNVTRSAPSSAHLPDVIPNPYHN
ncbi:MAG TPA: protein kinase [Polyangiales bacterium]|nr:protein kinase [Polyangiales bacterium]